MLPRFCTDVGKDLALRCLQILQLESALANLKAEHAGDDSQMAQQQQRIRQLEQQQQQLTQQLAAARCQAEEAQEMAQQCLQVAAAAVAHDTPGSSTSRGMYGQASSAASGPGDGTSSAGQTFSKAASVPGFGADERLSCGVGLLRDLPVAAQQEIAAQRRIAAAAKRDKVRSSRAWQEYSHFTRGSMEHSNAGGHFVLPVQNLQCYAFVLSCIHRLSNAPGG
jgi:septal ring factor EnvC (AmiA/AmiB activator)